MNTSSSFVVLDMLGAIGKSGAKQLHSGLSGARFEGVERSREAHVFGPVEAVLLALAHHRNELVAGKKAVACIAHYLY